MMREFRLRVGHALRQLREQQGMTLNRLAQLSGIDEGELAGMEAQSTDFPVDNLFRLSHILDFIPSDLLNGCEWSSPEQSRPPEKERAVNS